MVGALHKANLRVVLDQVASLTDARAVALAREFSD